MAAMQSSKDHHGFQVAIPLILWLPWQARRLEEGVSWWKLVEVWHFHMQYIYIYTLYHLVPLNNLLFFGCFSWMTPNLCLGKWLEITTHPFKTGCLGFQVYYYVYLYLYIYWLWPLFRLNVRRLPGFQEWSLTIVHPSNSGSFPVWLLAPGDFPTNILELSWWSLLVGGAEGAAPNSSILYKLFLGRVFTIAQVRSMWRCRWFKRSFKQPGLDILTF